jgi:hypothetical protein
MSASQPISLNGVVLSSCPVSVSSDALLSCFTIRNDDSYSTQADADVDCDTAFNGGDGSGVDVSNLGSRGGFAVSANPVLLSLSSG